MSKLETVLNKKNIPSSITPFFWQHGEDEETLRNEIRQMQENGIGGFVVESRPHPDFLGDGWWRDMDILLDEAKKRGMGVWFFDDSSFPSGYAVGKIRDNHPEYLKVYLDERHIDAKGPMSGSSFIIRAWLDKDETLVNVIAARRADGMDKIDGESLVDVTSQISDGILYWDVPAGDWRIFILIRTRNGGEADTKDYLNPIEPEPVKAFLEYVYEESYRKYADEFGKTIKGFFSDEPRFGNAGTYEGKLGCLDVHAPYLENGALHKMVLPYSDRLLDQLDQAWQGDFKRLLPCLWYDAGPMTRNVRYAYMDVVSRLFGECYTQQIGDWCRQHGVKYIGHVVEDNGVHARLGYGAGHFFRAIHGQDYSGMDVVFQIWPEFTSGKISSPFGYLDADFFYWGITKMASSAGHIDPKKDGMTVCEIFGAYGWQEGLKLMKWLTDHVCVRGVNWLIPHAFSPKFPDPDHPPHFYARGANPQWRYFHLWSNYANRLCNLLSGGNHIAPVAVIYHAEAEWAGKYMPFEKVVKVLAQRQIDCDVIPIDTIVGEEAVSMGEGCLRINKEEYKAVVVPYAECLPEEFIEKLLELAENGIPVIFMEDYPIHSCFRPDRFAYILDILKKNKRCMVCPLDAIVARLEELGLRDIEVASVQEDFRYYHYRNADEQIYFFTNESKHHAVDTTVIFKNEGEPPVAYDAMDDKLYRVEYCMDKESVSVRLNLNPYESICIVFGKESHSGNVQIHKKYIPGTEDEVHLIESCWDIYTVEADSNLKFYQKVDSSVLGNVAVPGMLPEFSGTLRYETRFVFNETGNPYDGLVLDLGEVYEIAEVWLNGDPAGVRICPPYRFDVTGLITRGDNLLRIDVTNTLAKGLGNNEFDRAMASGAERIDRSD